MGYQVFVQKFENGDSGIIRFEDIMLDPADIRFLCFYAVMFEANLVTDYVEQFFLYFHIFLPKIAGHNVLYCPYLINKGTKCPNIGSYPTKRT